LLKSRASMTVISDADWVTSFRGAKAHFGVWTGAYNQEW
jgi:hypothetical protein